MSILWHDFGLLISLALPLVLSTQAEQAPVFAVRTADGDVVRGIWRRLKSDGGVQVGAGEGTWISAANVLSVRRPDVPLPPLPMDQHLLLTNGDRIPFRDLRLVEEKFRFHHDNLDAGKDVSVPLAAVAVLWYAAPDKTLDADKLRRSLGAGTRTRDTVCLRNGDIVTGVLTELNANNATIDVDKRRTTVKAAQVAYVAFNTELADALRPKGPYAHLILRDSQPGRGGRLSVTSFSADETALTATTVFGARLRAPLRDIASFDPQHDHFVYLSDLKESKYTFQPFLDAAWPLARDGNAAGHDLLLAGSTYAKGIGMHSHSRLSYRLSGGYRRLEALAGLDDKDGRGGSVRLRVWADGATLWERAVTSGDGAVPVSLNIKGVRELTLEVDFGDAGDVRDVVNWADARLVK
jgi:hypothetical protein